MRPRAVKPAQFPILWHTQSIQAAWGAGPPNAAQYVGEDSSMEAAPDVSGEETGGVNDAGAVSHDSIP